MKYFDIQINTSEGLQINRLETMSFKVQNILDTYKGLFKNELGKYTGEEVRLETEDNIKPIFRKPRPVPYAYRDKVEQELDRLEKDGVTTKVPDSSWGTPLVPVVKSNGDIRLCANYKITVNKYLKEVKHPLPRIENIFTKLQGGQKFIKLDFLNAYNQLELDEKTSK